MTIEEFLITYDPKIQDVCLELRKIALELLPETEEILFEGWKNFTYGTGESRADKDLIIYIAPFNGVAFERTFASPIPNVRGVRVLTTTSPSWVAWFEIEVYGN